MSENIKPLFTGLARPNKKSPSLLIQFSKTPTDEQFSEIFEYLRRKYSLIRESDR